jgi:hypothetical protein
VNDNTNTNTSVAYYYNGEPVREKPRLVGATDSCPHCGHESPLRIYTAGEIMFESLGDCPNCHRLLAIRY